MSTSSLRTTSISIYRKSLCSVMESPSNKMRGRGRGTGGRYKNHNRGRGMSTNSVGAANNGHEFPANPSNNRVTKSPNKMKNCTTANNNPTTTPSVMIEKDDFIVNFHNKVRAAKYKVHAPNCDCSKVERVRKRYMDSQQNYNANATHDNDDIPITTAASQYGDGIQFDIDGGFSHQFDSQLLLSSDDATSNFDNLVVVPDTARPSAAYICLNTNSKQFQQNGIKCEQKLAMEIFGTKTGDCAGRSISMNGNIPPFKVSCGICLLTRHYWNGFVALVSSTFEQIQPVLKSARDAAQAKAHSGWHSDHAHFVCAVDISTMKSFITPISKTRSVSAKLIKMVLSQMNNSGVELSLDAQSFIDSNTATSQVAKIEIGHHLTSFLQLLTERTSKETNQFQYIMVIGYQDDILKWTLDLPGGKRHLGENTLEGAIREVEEECSLQLDSQWLESQMPKKYGGANSLTDGVVQVFEDSGNAYILIVATSIFGRDC
ncbi:hypothetical protein ACHAXN_008150 [Cyclotella atomus]